MQTNVSNLSKRGGGEKKYGHSHDEYDSPTSIRLVNQMGYPYIVIGRLALIYNTIMREVLEVQISRSVSYTCLVYIAMSVTTE